MESAILQFIKIILYNKTTKKFDSTLAPSTIDNSLLRFIENYLVNQNPFTKESDEIRNNLNIILENRIDFSDECYVTETLSYKYELKAHAEISSCLISYCSFIL